MTEQEKRMEAAGWKKCYWLGYGNLQTEYDYEPSEELVAECGDYPFQLDEEAIEWFIEDGNHPEERFQYFINDPDNFAFEWLEATMRMTPLENDFIQRAAKAMAKGFIEYLKSFRGEGIPDDVKKGYIEDLKGIVE